MSWLKNAFGICTFSTILVLFYASFALADFCTQCGWQIPDGAQFCPKCGFKVGSSTSDSNSKYQTEIRIGKTYRAYKTGNNEWTAEGESDLNESTYVAFKNEFQKLMWGGEISKDEEKAFLAELLAIIDKNGELCFGFETVRIYKEGSNLRMSSSGSWQPSAIWQNDITGKSYRLKITNRKIVISEER